MDPNKLLPILLLTAIACGRNSGTMQRGQQQYDVVQEGTSTAATSTIAAPGETAQPPMATAPGTNTAADTTTNFTLPGGTTTVATETEPATVAGTLPQPTATPMTHQTPRVAPRRTTAPNDNAPMSSSTSPTTTATVTQTTTSSTATATDTSSPTPPPTTDTTATGTQGWEEQRLRRFDV